MRLLSPSRLLVLAGSLAFVLLAFDTPAHAQLNCYPSSRIDLYPRPNAGGSPIGRSIDVQWLMGCAVCECGATEDQQFSLKINIVNTDFPMRPTGLLSLVIGPEICFSPDPTAVANVNENCAVLGTAQPYEYWYNSGGGQTVNFDPALLAEPSLKNATATPRQRCNPMGAAVSSAIGIYLVPNFAGAAPGAPVLRWQTCDSGSSMTTGGMTTTTGSLNAVPVKLYAPLPPQVNAPTPGKNALRVSWDISNVDTAVYQYQVLCKPVDSDEPTIANPPSPVFQTGPSRCGDQAAGICDGYSLAGGGTVTPPPPAPVTDGGIDMETLTNGTGTGGTGVMSFHPLAADGGVLDGGVADAAVTDGAATEGGVVVVGDGGTADGGVADLGGTDAGDPVLNQLYDPKYVCSGGVIAPNNQVRIEGLDNDREYIVAVVAVDRFGNGSKPGSFTTGVPMDTIDFYQSYRIAGGSSEGGYCFVATAAYGTYDHPMVRILRHFRDDSLKTTAAGRLLVDAYYAVSPPLARFVEKSELRRATARAVLWPFVFAAAGWTYSSGVERLLFFGMLALSAGLLWRRRKRRQALALDPVTAPTRIATPC